MPLTVDSPNTGSILQIIVTGKVNDEDCKQLMAVINAIASRQGRVRLKFHLAHFEGWTASVGWRVADVKACGQVSRIALVGEKPWEQGGTRLCAPFLHADVRYFSDAEAHDAQQWLEDPHREHVKRAAPLVRIESPAKVVFGRRALMAGPSA